MCLTSRSCWGGKQRLPGSAVLCSPVHRLPVGLRGVGLCHVKVPRQILHVMERSWCAASCTLFSIMWEAPAPAPLPATSSIDSEQTSGKHPSTFWTSSSPLKAPFSWLGHFHVRALGGPAPGHSTAAGQHGPRLHLETLSLALPVAQGSREVLWVRL